MKYCPYCGAALMRSAISFCTECGRSIEETSDGTPEPFRIPDPHEETEERREVIWNLPETKNAPGGKPYDGYYDDIVPEDGTVDFGNIVYLNIHEKTLLIGLIRRV